MHEKKEKRQCVERRKETLIMRICQEEFFLNLIRTIYHRICRQFSRNFCEKIRSNIYIELAHLHPALLSFISHPHRRLTRLSASLIIVVLNLECTENNANLLHHIVASHLSPYSAILSIGFRNFFEIFNEGRTKTTDCLSPLLFVIFSKIFAEEFSC